MSGICFVEASAGAGKTRWLTQEIAAAVASGVPIDRIAAVTFTHAAAGSMKIRVRQEMERMQDKESPERRERLRAGLQSLDRAFIGTIHSFCAHLLRQRPVEACVDPDFIELSQPEALAVFARVFQGWAERNLAGPSKVFSRALIRLAGKDDRSGDGPLFTLRDAAWKLAEWRDYCAPWEHREFGREPIIRQLIARAASVIRLRNLADRVQDPLYQNLQPVAAMMDRLQGLLDLDKAENEILSVRYELPRYPKWGSGRFSGSVSREAVLAEWKGFCEQVEQFRTWADADLVSALREDLWEAVEEYGKAKQRAGHLDFTDLLISTRNLLQNPHARSDLQRRYDRLYIDEFQDTDPLQTDILLLLCSADSAAGHWTETRPSDGKLFLVGDPKQSIYRFRRADARHYRKVRDHLLGAGVPADTLHSSERSTDAIQTFVNAAFETCLPEYLPLTGGPPAPESQPAVVALPVPHIYSGRFLSRRMISQSAPAATAAFIQWLVESSGWTVRDTSGGGRVPVAPGHICILFRRFVSFGTDLTQEYVRALEARNIDHVLVGSRSFHQREEVGTLRNALRAVEWPDDQLSVFAVLRGTLFFIADSTLLRFREKYRRFSAFADMSAEADPEFERIADAFRLLRDLHARRNYRSPAETIRHLLEHTRAHAGFAFHYGGERRLANVYRLADLARAFELTGPSSFRAFVEYLEAEHISGEQSEAPVLEQHAGGVQLMTVHKSKGLEFPIVILSDITTHKTRRDGTDRYLDHERGLCAQRLCNWSPWELIEHGAEEQAEDENEGNRIAYVAATRARDLLVVTAVGEPGWDGGWLSPLDDALYPARDRWRTTAPFPGMPLQGNATVLDRPPDLGAEEVSVRPGVHVPRCGSGNVLWFDPSLLDLKDQETQGLDYEELLAGSPAEGLSEYREWQAVRAARIERASEPRFQVARATDTGRTPDADSIPLEVIPAARTQRPAGRIFGRLVHAILQSGKPAAIDRLSALHGRRWNASPEEIAAAAETARAALAHPAVAAAAAVETFREMPVSVTLSSGVIVEGVIDFAWSDGERWTVVDYKTGGTGRRYDSQVRLYAFALQQATGLPARAVLLEI